MSCLQCGSCINFDYHILRYTTDNRIVGYGNFCSTICAKEKAKTTCYGDSDYFDTLSLMLQKYGEENGIKTFYSPKEVREIRPLLEPVEFTQPVIPRYNVKKASANKKTMNDVLKNEFFTGKHQPIMTAKNLCTSK